VSAAAPFVMAGSIVEPGHRGRVAIATGSLISGAPIALDVHVMHGRTVGPAVWISAAVHGDEILGVEIIRRVLSMLKPRQMAGTVVALPIVNVHGFNTGDRNLPDRRDLNRSFPGSARGSFAGRLAHTFMEHIVNPCEIGLDLHTGALGRSNLPQVRADLSDPRTLELAEVFGAPVAITSSLRDGSLRQVATERGKTVLLFEGGEALRFDNHAIEVGTAGVLRVLQHVGVYTGEVERGVAPAISPRSSWVRTTRSGVVHTTEPLGAWVTKGQVVGRVYNPSGTLLSSIKSRHDGVVIGLAQHPLLNRGEAVCHIAEMDSTPREVRAALASVPDTHDHQPSDEVQP
jgi:predicted deacylase